MVLNAATSRAHLIVTSTTSTAADFEELLQKLPSSSQVNISSSWLAKLDTKSLNQLQENLQERKEQSMDIPLTCQVILTHNYSCSSSTHNHFRPTRHKFTNSPAHPESTVVV